MGKHNQIKYLKKTRARTTHQCGMCNETVEPGDYYYAETPQDRFLHSLQAKRFCSKCYEKYGDQLLSERKKKIHKINKSRSIENFL